ncbi:MAG: response regulator [Nitrospirae bacterium]|nr:response regulator [Nitrospirota bacterium]
MNSKKVLVVDDEAFIIMMLKDKLENAGIKVLSSTNGKEAIEKARAERPDLIILDWMMPGISGLDACRIIKADSSLSNIPIIMLTAKGQESDERLCIEAGVAHYLTKPFSPRKVLKIVQETIQVNDS